MEKRNDTRIVLGSLRNKVQTDTDILLNPPLEQTQNELLETDRTSTINLIQIFDEERQSSTNFRVTFNVKFLHENNLIGTSNYNAFRDNLYYVDNYYNAPWYSGYPQSVEFDLIRNDVNNQHIPFVAKSATTYNWNYFLSYGVENNYTTQLQYSDETNTVNWLSGDGIPVFINIGQQNGTNTIEFRSFVKHGLIEGEFIKLVGLVDVNQFVFPPTSGTNIYEVYSVGNGEYGTDEYIFNVIDIGYPSGFFNGVALFKRVLDPNNALETTSKYYIRRNKILTNLDDLTLTYNGYQYSSFKEEKKYEFSAITPNNVSRVSIKNSNRTYNVTNANDINISGLTDNNGKPVSELFLTFINKGYMGWFNYPNQGFSLPPISNTTPPALKKGWYFNLTNNLTNPWWENNNPLSDTNIPTNWYTNGGYTFFYNQSPVKNDIIDGDFCEYNDYEQIERKISSHFHKVKFNSSVFSIANSDNVDSGYYYQAHFPIRIRAFSSYVEVSRINEADFYPDPLNYSGYTAVDIPSYAFFSSYDQQWRWRDVYTYGYIDNDGVGVDFPYLNKSHYPYSSIFFRLIPDNANYLGYSSIITQPLIDDCE